MVRYSGYTPTAPARAEFEVRLGALRDEGSMSFWEEGERRH
jgi:hypothetical protein